MIGLIFDALLTKPLITILAGIYQGLVLLHIPYPLGFSLILLTAVVRLVLYPLTHSQLRASKKMQDLAPHISKLKDKHQHDKARIQQETMKLYKEHGVNPAAGCLPMIVQLPIIWALYGALQKVVGLSSQQILNYVNSHVYISAFKLSVPWDQHFFGLLLGQSPSHILQTMPFIIAVPVITAALQFVQSKMMVPVKPVEAKKSKEPKQDDFASAFQTQSMYIFPFMIGLFSYQLPIGLSLYWNTFTLFGILQQYQLNGWGGLLPNRKK